MASELDRPPTRRRIAKGERAPAIAFSVAIVAALVLVVVYWRGGQPQAEGVLLALAAVLWLAILVRIGISVAWPRIGWLADVVMFVPVPVVGLLVARRMTGWPIARITAFRRLASQDPRWKRPSIAGTVVAIVATVVFGMAYTAFHSRVLAPQLAAA